MPKRSINVTVIEVNKPSETAIKEFRKYVTKLVDEKYN